MARLFFAFWRRSHFLRLAFHWDHYIAPAAGTAHALGVKAHHFIRLYFVMARRTVRAEVEVLENRNVGVAW
jgi:hypothetical protein